MTLGLLTLLACRSNGLPVYLLASVHVEGEDLTDQLAALGTVADTVARRGGALNIEGRELFHAQGIHDLAMLRWLALSGHAFGIHEDIARLELSEEAHLTALLESSVADLAALGLETYHASGVCSELDWVHATDAAGLSAVAGATLWCAKSLDPSIQPSSVADCIDPQRCHWPWPEDLVMRVHPWKMNSGADWVVPDPDGAVWMIPTADQLPCNVEAHAVPNGCVFDAADIDLYFVGLDAALNEVSPEAITTYRTVWSMGPALDPALLTAWLDRLQPYVQSGRVQWVTIPELLEILG